MQRLTLTAIFLAALSFAPLSGCAKKEKKNAKQETHQENDAHDHSSHEGQDHDSHEGHNH